MGTATRLATFLGATTPRSARAIAQSPADTLSGHPKITSDETAAAYLKASLDLTMEGGTTSGWSIHSRSVSWPPASGSATLAAHPPARSRPLHRGRRARSQRAVGGHQQLDQQASRPSKKINSVQVRRGFTGLTDIIGWLTQTLGGSDRSDQPRFEIDQTGPAVRNRPAPSRPFETDQYRLAQLFRPGQRTARIFRVAVAAMRGRTWPLPLLALFAFGRFTRLATLALILGAIVLSGYVNGDSLEPLLGARAHRLAVITGVLFYIITLVGIALIGQGIRSGFAGEPTPKRQAGSKSCSNTPAGTPLHRG